jgi:uncharacterized protein YegL
MAGENLRKMQEGVQDVVRNLLTDPFALETVYVSVIAFAGVARTVVPLVEVASFYPPRLPLGGGTSLGLALVALMDEIDKTVIKSTTETKGDWSPIIYLFTDGRCTDSPAPAVARWRANYSKRASMIAVGVGQQADFLTLGELSETVIAFEDSRKGNFSTLFNWITDSVRSHSRSILENQNHPTPVFDDAVMKLVKGPMPEVDDVCVTFVGRCQRTNRPYIVKYERETTVVKTRDFKMDVANYLLAGCYPLDEDYFAWSDEKIIEHKVNTASLGGTPVCPQCGNITAFAVCDCGRLMCAAGPEEAICPWCSEAVVFGSTLSDEDVGFDVRRGRG